jgi:2-iminobutanoate/2-iminopropanoate deaminase
VSAIQRFPTALPVPFSRAVRAGDFLFLSGILPLDDALNVIDADVQGQTRLVLERVAAMLAGLGAEMGDVVKAMVWLADLADFSAFNQEYAKQFAGALPSRSCVQATLYKGARVEIEVQAYVPTKSSK